MVFEATVKVHALEALKAIRNAIDVATDHGIESYRRRHGLNETAIYIEDFLAKIAQDEINARDILEPATHDGGPDKIDGAPSDGWI